jgi:mutual gliding-motility protein MglA
MAFLNDATGEVHFKILYAGARGAGKTTNLQSLYRQTSADLDSRMFDLQGVPTQKDFFEFLPLTLSLAEGRKQRLHLFTWPDHDLYPSLNQTLLMGLDGIVFVVDSRAWQMSSNEEAWSRLQRQKVAFAGMQDVPFLFQFNHRDSPQALPLQALRTFFVSPWGSEKEAIATQDVGILDTLDALSQLLIPPNENGENQAFAKSSASENLTPEPGKTRADLTI